MMTRSSPEITLLLMACTNKVTSERQLQLIEFLDQHTLNWDRLYTLASYHRIVPFLYRIVQKLPNVPESILASLKNDCRTIATDNLIKFHEYAQLKQILAKHQIEYMPMKGIYLAENSYPDSSLRSIGDFDILISRKDLFKTINLLETEQYRLGETYRHYLRYKEEIIVEDLHEVSLFKRFFNTSYFNIDLHWEVDCFNKYYSSIYLDEVHDNPAFVVEYHIILVVIHHGLTNIWQYIGYINDLYFLLKDQPTDWSFLMQKLEEYDSTTIFLVGLYWCQQVWQLSLPPSIQALITTDRIRVLAEAYEKNWDAKPSVWNKNPSLKRVILFTNSQTQQPKKLKIYRTYISNIIFRSTTFKIGKRRFYIRKELGLVTVLGRVINSFSQLLTAQR